MGGSTDGSAPEDLWHLAIADLLLRPNEAGAAAGAGPYVITLSTSGATQSVPAAGVLNVDNLYVYQVKQWQDGEPRFRLRIGPIASALEADVVLASMRERYPQASAGVADEDDLNAMALAVARATKPVTSRPAKPGSPKPSEPATTDRRRAQRHRVASSPEPQARHRRPAADQLSGEAAAGLRDLAADILATIEQKSEPPDAPATPRPTAGSSRALSIARLVATRDRGAAAAAPSPSGPTRQFRTPAPLDAADTAISPRLPAPVSPGRGPELRPAAASRDSTSAALRPAGSRQRLTGGSILSPNDTAPAGAGHAPVAAALPPDDATGAVAAARPAVASPEPARRVQEESTPTSMHSAPAPLSSREHASAAIAESSVSEPPTLLPDSAVFTDSSLPTGAIVKIDPPAAAGDAIAPASARPVRATATKGLFARISRMLAPAGDSTKQPSGHDQCTDSINVNEAAEMQALLADIEAAPSAPADDFALPDWAPPELEAHIEPVTGAPAESEPAADLAVDPARTPAAAGPAQRSSPSVVPAATAETAPFPPGPLQDSPEPVAWVGPAPAVTPVTAASIAIDSCSAPSTSPAGPTGRRAGATLLSRLSRLLSTGGKPARESRADDAGSEMQPALVGGSPPTASAAIGKGLPDASLPSVGQSPTGSSPQATAAQFPWTELPTMSRLEMALPVLPAPGTGVAASIRVPLDLGAVAFSAVGPLAERSPTEFSPPITRSPSATDDQGRPTSDRMPCADTGPAPIVAPTSGAPHLAVQDVATAVGLAGEGVATAALRAPDAGPRPPTNGAVLPVLEIAESIAVFVRAEATAFEVPPAPAEIVAIESTVQRLESARTEAVTASFPRTQPQPGTASVPAPVVTEGALPVTAAPEMAPAERDAGRSNLGSGHHAAEQSEGVIEVPVLTDASAYADEEPLAPVTDVRLPSRQTRLQKRAAPAPKPAVAAQARVPARTVAPAPSSSSRADSVAVLPAAHVANPPDVTPGSSAPGAARPTPVDSIAWDPGAASGIAETKAGTTPAVAATPVALATRPPDAGARARVDDSDDWIEWCSRAATGALLQTPIDRPASAAIGKPPDPREPRIASDAGIPSIPMPPSPAVTRQPAATVATRSPVASTTPMAAPVTRGLTAPPPRPTSPTSRPSTNGRPVEPTARNGTGSDAATRAGAANAGAPATSATESDGLRTAQNGAPAASAGSPPAHAKAAAAGAVAPTLKAPSKAAPSLDHTQTMRALTPFELADSEAPKLFVIQLALSDSDFHPEDVPNLAIFEAYRLYAAMGIDADGRVRRALRLGFFSDRTAADAVAGYLRAHFEAPTVTQVSHAEQERFAAHRIAGLKDPGETGVHAAIELSSPPAQPTKRLAELASPAAQTASADSPS